jgi:glycerol-3-phosphate acyltransferase PlsY
MNPWIATLSVFVGYFLGAISFTRIVGHYIAPGDDMGKADIPIRGSDKSFYLHSYGATSIRAKAGAKYGCFTSILDMIKITLPTLAFRLLYPEESYFLIAAASGVAGHNFPIFYKLRGGRGFSPIYGGLLVIDWLAIPVTTILGSVAGFLILRYPFVSYFGVTLLLIPWFWIRFSESAYVMYAVAVNLFFWIASIPELKLYQTYKRSGEFDKAGRFEGLDDEFTCGPLITYVRRLGLRKDAKWQD